MNFNPNNHMTQIKTKDGFKDYLPVQWRLVWFRQDNPEGTIETEAVTIDLDRETEEEGFAWNEEKRKSEKIMKRANGFAVFRARITDGKGGIATGTKSEKAASFPDYIEKAETGAIGRALAGLGYGTQFVGEEFDEGERIVDAPVTRKASEQPITSQPRQNTSQPSQTVSRPSQSVTEANKQPANVVALIGKAKDRAKVLGIGWSVIKMNSGTGTIADEELTIQHIGKINGLLAAKEREKQGAA